MGSIKKFQCQLCLGIVETEYDDEYVICGHCESACLVPKEFGPGVVIDDFVVAKLLGEGGMGNVYLAHQFSLDRKVALKILKDDFLKDPKFKDEFIYEARNVACLNHPNIIQAYKVGEENGMVFFAMEYVEGRNLKDILKEEGAISEKLAISVAMEIVAALGYAWNLRKLVHRDIKPENIMMTNDGTAKLMDLGLSLRDGDDKDEGDMIAGTPQYISPEQILGTEMDIRGDFYCLGATLYHLVSGKLPFEGNLQQIVKSHLSEKPPSLRKVVPGIDDFFAKIIHKMMSKKPENRYECADALLSAFKKDMKLIEDAEHGKKHFKISTQNNIKTATQTSGFQRRKKKDPLLVASIVMLAILVGGFVIIKMFMGGNSASETIASKTKPVSSGAGSDRLPPTKNEGLYYRYYHSETEQYSAVANGTLTESGIAKSLFSEAPDGRKASYGVFYDGFIKIPQSGTYKFYLNSLGACRIFINGTKLLDTIKIKREVAQSITLNSGYHPIKVEYGTSGAQSKIEFKVESVSIDKMDVPFSWFYRLGPEKRILKISKNKKGVKLSTYNPGSVIDTALRSFPEKTEVTNIIDHKIDNSGKAGSYMNLYEGLLKVPKPGEYTFYLKSGAKSHLQLNDSLVLYNCSSLGKESSIRLKLRELSRIRVFHFYSGKSSSLDLEIEGNGLSRQKIPSQWLYQETNESYLSQLEKYRLNKIINLGPKGKLNYKHYLGKFEKLATMLKEKPSSQGTVDHINVNKIKAKTNYGYLFYGSLRVPERNNYKFYLEADDQAIFIINGKSVFASTKVKGRAVEVPLSKGRNNFNLSFIQYEGSSFVKLYIESDKIPKMLIPSSWFNPKVVVEQSSVDEPVKKREADIEPKVKAAAVSPLKLKPAFTKQDSSLESGLRYTLYKNKSEPKTTDEMLKGEVLKKDGECNKINVVHLSKGLDELFGVVFTGYLRVLKDGKHTYILGSNDGSKLYLDDQLLIDNDGRHSHEEKSVTLDLKAGFYKLRIEYFQGHLDKSLDFIIKNSKGDTHPVRNSSLFRLKNSKKHLKENIEYKNNSKDATVVSAGRKLSLAPHATLKPKSLEQGIKYTLYKSNKDLLNIEQMLASRKVTSGVTDVINSAKDAGAFEDNYGLVYEGYIKMAKDVDVTFSLQSNDDAMLYLQDKLIINNDRGRKDNIIKTRVVSLKNGLYKIKVVYYQDNNRKFLDLRMSNAAGKLIPVNAHRFLHNK